MATQTIDDQLRRRAALLAQALAAGQITLEQLRAAWQQELSHAITIAFLSGTGGMRNAEIDARLRELIVSDKQELERLIQLLGRQAVGGGSAADIQRRLESFADNLDNIQAEGERLAQQPDLSPLVPVGAALAALLLRTITPGRILLPSADALLAHFGTLFDDLASQLSGGQLTPGQWLEAMRIADRNLHAALYRTGVGRTLDGQDLQRLNDRIKAQWDYLDGFAEDIRSGTLTPEQIRQRARMYLDNGQASLQEGAVARLGFTLPAQPKDGSTRCLTKCHCFWDIRAVDGGYDCYWKLRPAEHCEECINRDALWAPIQVRNGVLGPYSTIGTFV